jgi:hypothetical protein
VRVGNKGEVAFSAYMRTGPNMEGSHDMLALGESARGVMFQRIEGIQAEKKHDCEWVEWMANGAMEMFVVILDESG